MTAPDDTRSRARLWVALGNQPGVAAWFSVWMLARDSRRRTGERSATKPSADSCATQVKRSPV